MWRGTAQSGLIEDEVRNDPKRGFVGGYYLQLVGFDPTGVALGALPYGWGRDYAAVMEGFANMASIIMVGEDLPRANNRITLSTTTRDAFGLPAAHVHVDEHDNDIAMRRHGLQQARQVFEAAGAKRVLLSEGSPQATHNMGTARMSLKPEEGVVNPWGQTHDVKNLFVSDGSVFTTPAAANPTLTIVALALRQAEYIRQQMGARAI
jgi:choline dehydrogenase-like flavoprotein